MKKHYLAGALIALFLTGCSTMEDRRVRCSIESGGTLYTLHTVDREECIKKAAAVCPSGVKLKKQERTKEGKDHYFMLLVCP